MTIFLNFVASVYGQNRLVNIMVSLFHVELYRQTLRAHATT